MSSEFPFIARPGYRACWSVIGLTAIIAFVELQLIQPIGQLGAQFEMPGLSAQLTVGILCALVLTILAGAGRVLWIRYGAVLHLMEDSIEVQHGVIARRRNKIRLAHIRAIETNQNLLDRLLDTGTLELSTAGTTEADVRVRYLNEPVAIRHRIREAIDALKQDVDLELLAKAVATGVAD